MEKIQIIIVDDDLITRTGLTYFLRKYDKHEIIAEAESGKQFLELLNVYQPDIVLMDINMSGLDGVAATKAGINRYTDLKVIAITSDETDKAVEDMIFAGAKGFLMKTVGAVELEKAISIVLSGGRYFTPKLMRHAH